MAIHYGNPNVAGKMTIFLFWRSFFFPIGTFENNLADDFICLIPSSMRFLLTILPFWRRVSIWLIYFFSHIFLFKTTISTIPQEVSSSCLFTHGQPGHQQDASECWTQRWSYDERSGGCVRSMVGSQSAHLDEVFDHQRQPDFVVNFCWLILERKPEKRHLLALWIYEIWNLLCSQYFLNLPVFLQPFFSTLTML